MSMSPGKHFPDDDYHPHYPVPATSMYVEDGYEYGEPARMANPYRLMCCIYTEAQEAYLLQYWQERKGRTLNRD